MKKNIVGHMTMPKPSKKTVWRRLDLIPRLLCLLLALIIWLFVSNINANDPQPQNEVSEQVTVQDVSL